MARGSYYIEETPTKYIFHIELPDGSSKTISGYSREQLMSETKRLLSSGNFGRPRGTKNYAGRHMEVRDIQRMFGSVLNKASVAVNGAAAAAHVESMSEIAQALINRVSGLASQRKNFNSYTGALANSFVVSVINDGGVRLRVTPSIRIQTGNVHTTERGARYAELIEQHHPVAGFIYINKKSGKKYKHGVKLLKKNGKIIRYLRKYEREGSYYDAVTGKRKWGSGGYDYNATVGGRKWTRLNLGSNQERSKTGFHSVITLENTAPYADAVQRAGYKVLVNASAQEVIGDITLKQRSLIQVVTKRMLKEAGFNIK